MAVKVRLQKGGSSGYIASGVSKQDCERVSVQELCVAINPINSVTRSPERMHLKVPEPSQAVLNSGYQVFKHTHLPGALHIETSRLLFHLKCSPLKTQFNGLQCIYMVTDTPIKPL